MSAIISAGTIRRFACLVCAACLISSLAAAQEEKKKVKPPTTAPPKAAWPPAEAKFMAPKEPLVKKILAAGALAPGDEDILRAYFGTLVTGFKMKEVIPGLWEVRQDMRKWGIEAGKAPADGAQKWLRDFLFTEMKKLVADDKLSITSRVNALLVIGDLNEKEPQLSRTLALEAPPVPLIAATPYLLQIYDNPQMPLPLRTTALRGLHRHAELGIAPANKPAVLASMLKAVQDANVPKDCSPAAYEFLRRRAVENLGHLKDPSAAAPLVAIIGDDQVSLTFRCDAARSLGLLTLKPGDPAAATPAVALALGELAAEVAETEKERRVLHDDLDDVRTALNGPNPKVRGGVRAATPQADAKLADELFGLIDPYVKNIDPSNTKYKEEQLVEETQGLAYDLRNKLPQVPAAKAKPVKKPEKVEPKAVEPKEDPKAAAPKTDNPPKVDPAKTKAADKS